MSNLNVQLAGSPLDASNQISFGGANSLVGYQRDFLLADNGIIGSAGVSIPILTGKQGSLNALSNFIVGYGWDSRQADYVNATLASIDLGLQYQDPSKRFSVNLNLGIPLLEVNGQSSGNPRLLFGLNWSF